MTRSHLSPHVPAWFVCLAFIPFVLISNGLAAPPEPRDEDPITAAMAAARQDLNTAQTDLETVRERIAAERMPLRTELQSLTDAVTQLRRQAMAIADARRQDERLLQQARVDARQRADDLRFMGEQFMEYRRGMETRVAAGEASERRRQLALIDAELPLDPEVPETLPDAIAAIADAAIRAQRDRIGGLRGSGTVITEDGTEYDAMLMTIGPISFGVTVDHEMAGIALSRPGLFTPGLYTAISPAEQAAIRALLSGEQATVPFDVTPQGDAMRAAGRQRTFREELRSGGLVMVPLLAVGIAALFLTIWKLVEMRGVCVQDTDTINSVLSELQREDEAKALTVAASTGAPLSALLRDAITCRHAPREHIEEILHEHIVAGIPRLERHLGTLAVLGGIAPLLGLLGTVTGMMHTFQLVTLFGTGEARLLSGGISEALITTKFGLSIAIPILLVHAMLVRYVRTRVGHLETSAVMFVNRLKQNEGARE